MRAHSRPRPNPYQRELMQSGAGSEIADIELAGASDSRAAHGELMGDGDELGDADADADVDDSQHAVTVCITSEASYRHMQTTAHDRALLLEVHDEQQWSHGAAHAPLPLAHRSLLAADEPAAPSVRAVHVAVIQGSGLAIEHRLGPDGAAAELCAAARDAAAGHSDAPPLGALLGAIRAEQSATHAVRTGRTHWERPRWLCSAGALAPRLQSLPLSARLLLSSVAAEALVMVGWGAAVLGASDGAAWREASESAFFGAALVVCAAGLVSACLCAILLENA